MLNELFLLGRVGKKDVKSTVKGGSMASLSVATFRKHISESGERKEYTTWHNVYFYAKLADIVQQYVHVGDLVFIKGEVNNRKMEAGEKAGQWIYSVIANEIKFIPSNKKRESVEDCSSADYASAKHNYKPEINEDEVPF